MYNEEDFYQETHLRKSSVGSLVGGLVLGSVGSITGLGPILGPIGSIAGWLIGRTKWRNDAGKELMGFVQDLAESISKGQSIKYPKRVRRVLDGCEVALQSRTMSDKEKEAVKKLSAATKALENEDLSPILDYINNTNFIKANVNSPLPIAPIPAMTKKAIENWTKAANECRDVFENKDAVTEYMLLDAVHNIQNAEMEAALDVLTAMGDMTSKARLITESYQDSEFLPEFDVFDDLMGLPY